LEEYREIHRNVWPEMRAALSAAGISNYSIFLRDDGLLVGYLEGENPRESLLKLRQDEVNLRWQKLTAPFFESGMGDPKTYGHQWLEEAFHLP
jgi:L-rhamnose mutarotase